MEIFFTKEKQWLEKWDEFVYNNAQGNHLVFSDWLDSYKSYGFDFEIGLFLVNKKIVGGFGAVIAKMSFFKFYIVPHGPIVNTQDLNAIDFLVQNLSARAKKLKCCYAQYSIPFSENNIIKTYCYSSDLRNIIKDKGVEGNLFKYIYSSYGINWLDFYNLKSPEELLKNFALQPRRNINLAYRNNLEISFAKTEEDCRKAYQLIEKNSKEGNYSVREFEDIKKTILNLIDTNRAFFMIISQNDELKGSGLFLDNGKYLTYISGGTTKEKPDLNVGYLIHWEAVRKSYEMGYKGYNISMGGSEGVQKFKAKFMADPILFDKPHYHFIIRPIIFNLYLFLNKYIKKNKERISVIIKRFK